MQELSLQKKSFFNSIGLDINNLPQELQIKAGNMQKNLPQEDLRFLNNNELTKTETKHFRLKNLVGTDDITCDNKTWIDILINNDKSDNIIKQYFKNPNYYFKELRRLDQSELNHNGELELYEDNGKYFVKEGIGRLSLMMTKFLLEMSRAHSKEEKLLVNKQYIFAANVRSLPKDRDIIYLINMLIDLYGEKLKIEKVDSSEECNYILKYGSKTIEIKSKQDLENFVRNVYLPKEYKSIDKLEIKLQNFTKLGLEYKEDESKLDAFIVMGKIFPNYEIFVKYYKKILKLNLEDCLYEKLDLTDITYEQILKTMIKIIKQEGKVVNQKLKEKVNEDVKEIKKKSLKAEGKKSLKKEEKVEAKEIEKEAIKKPRKQVSKAKKEEIDVPEEIVEEVSGKKNKTKKAEKSEEDIIKEKVEKEQEKANQLLDAIQENVELMYYKLKKEESKTMDLANSTNVVLNIDRINDENINQNIHSIKAHTLNFRKKISACTNLDDLKDYTEILSDLKSTASDKKILIQYTEEMSSIFNRCFNKTLVKMITDSKIRKLDIERTEIENEKCSFFSKLIGKAKLKQARLDNINLKKQLVLSESQYTDKVYYYLEDGLSEVYAYMKTEDNQDCLTDIKFFLKNVESNLQLKSLIDQNKLNNLIREKTDQHRNLPVITLSKEKRKLFSKAQINLMEEKNNELKKVIQITRANSLKQQNTGVIPIIGNIKATKSLNKFYNILNEINLTLKYQCD